MCLYAQLLRNAEIFVGASYTWLVPLESRITSSDETGLYIHYEEDTEFDIDIVALRFDQDLLKIPLEYVLSRGVLLPIELHYTKNWWWLLRRHGVIWPTHAKTFQETAEREPSD